MKWMIEAKTITTKPMTANKFQQKLADNHNLCVYPEWGMSLGKVTALGSNLASVTNLKRIQTPHSLCCDFGGYKTFTTRWSGGRVQVWVQVWAPASHLAISLKAVPEGNQRFTGQNQQPSSWGHFPALLALVGGQQRVIFHVKWKFRWKLREVVADQSSIHSFAQSFDHSLVSE